MVNLCRVILVSMLLVSSCNGTPSFKLDHFITYRVNLGYSKEVKVNDQILTFHNIKIKAKIDSLYQFAIPVSKNNEGIKDKFAHFNWYRIEEITTDDQHSPNQIPKTVITYRNQFTGFKPTVLTIGNPEGLLLPAEKIEAGSKFPDELDHYLCYKVVSSGSISKTVTLKGQFTDVKPTAVGPTFFCVPCSKEGQKIKNQEDHLVIYRLDNSKGFPEDSAVTSKDQWRELTFVPTRQDYLLVPTKKDKVSKEQTKKDREKE